MVTIVAQGMRFAIRMVSTVVLARMLTPEDFGLIAMVTALTGFAMIFRDLGLSMATIQSSTISHQQVSNLFWVNVTVGLLVTTILLAGAPAVGLVLRRSPADPYRTRFRRSIRPGRSRRAAQGPAEEADAFYGLEYRRHHRYGHRRDWRHRCRHLRGLATGLWSL